MPTAETAVVHHILHCTHCQEEVAALRKADLLLAHQLYREDCPEAMVLLEYEVGFLAEDEKTAVAILNSLYQAHHDTPQATVDAPLYAALTGVPKEPPIPKILGIIGKQRALARLGRALRTE